MQIDGAVADDGGRERQRDAEFLELDRHLVVALRDQDRELAAGEEARRLAGHRGQVRLGKHGDQPLVGEGVNHRVDVPAR
jgi:hypothetical protein